MPQLLRPIWALHKNKVTVLLFFICHEANVSLIAALNQVQWNVG